MDASFLPANPAQGKGAGIEIIPARGDRAAVTSLFLSADRIGQVCIPPLNRAAIEFEAALHDWPRQSRRATKDRVRTVYSLTAAIRTLGLRLIGPLAAAALDQWAAGPLNRPCSEQQTTIETASEAARTLAMRRLTILRMWAKYVQRAKRQRVRDATDQFSLMWNLAKRWGITLSCRTLFRWAARFRTLGAAGLIDGRALPRATMHHKKIPADLWRFFWRAWNRLNGPSIPEAHRAALAECPAASREALAAEFGPALFARRVAVAPDWLIELAALGRRCGPAAPITAALARSPRVLAVLSHATGGES